MGDFAVDRIYSVMTDSNGHDEISVCRYFCNDITTANARYIKCLEFPGTIQVKVLKKNIRGRYEVIVVGDPDVWEEENCLSLPVERIRPETHQKVLF